MASRGKVTLKLIRERLSDQYFDGVSQGWPKVLAELKKLLEAECRI
jgi:hypothetical protein